MQGVGFEHLGLGVEGVALCPGLVHPSQLDLDPPTGRGGEQPEAEALSVEVRLAEGLGRVLDPLLPHSPLCLCLRPYPFPCFLGLRISGRSLGMARVVLGATVYSHQTDTHRGIYKPG